MITFNQETKNIGARVEFRACISAAIFAVIRSSHVLATIVLGLLKAVPFITKQFQDDWSTIDAEGVNFAWGESENGYRAGAQTFGPWDKKLDPNKFPQSQVFPDVVSKDDIEMRIIISMNVDDDLYIDGVLADAPGYASYVYKELPWEEGKTVSLDIENNYAEATPGYKHPYGGSGSITVQTRLKPGSCSYYNRLRIRDFKYGMYDQAITYSGLDNMSGSLRVNCKRFETTPCQNFPPEQSRRVKGRETTFPPPPGRKTPPCPRYVSMANFGVPPRPSIHRLSSGPLGQFQNDFQRRTLCDTQMTFKYMLGVDVVPNGLKKNTCSALFLSTNLLEIFTFLEDPTGVPLGTWEDVSLPGGNTSPKLDALINARLREYFKVYVNLSSRYYDRIDTQQNRCVCNNLEASSCVALDPASVRAIERALWNLSCTLAFTMLAGALARIALTPAGAVCLGGAAAVILLTPNPHNGGGGGGKPPNRTL